MTLQRMDNVLIVVDDLEAAKAFFIELGMEMESEMGLEGRWVDLVVGLENVRSKIATLRTLDGHSRIELSKFHAPLAIKVEPKNAPVNTLGMRASCLPLTISMTSWRACVCMALNSSGKSLSTKTSTDSASSAVPRELSLGLPSNSGKL